MLYALPEGFPTPEPRDGKGLAKALGDAAARWMRGEYAEALARMHAAVVIAATERATNARIDRLERVVARLDAWISACDRGEEVAPPSLNESIDISVVVPERPATERTSNARLAGANPHENEGFRAPETMTLESRDLEIVDVAQPARPAATFVKPGATPAIAHNPLSTTLEEASRPTAREKDPSPIVLPRTPLGTTLQEGAVPSSSALGAARRDPFAGLDGAATPSASDAPKAAASVPDGTPVTIDSKDDEEKPRSKISTQRFVPPTTRRPAEGEVYPPMLPSEEDEGEG